MCNARSLNRSLQSSSVPQTNTTAVAKEQGLRSRAAFKLSQINRQYPILNAAPPPAAASDYSRGGRGGGRASQQNQQQNPQVVLDLCAAPGGWTQIAARVCGPNTRIVAVDVLPIRNLNLRNVHTIVGDITTDKCKADISRSVTTFLTANDGGGGGRNGSNNKGGGTVDVVLHDGAPNIGASYDKDAYEQTELAVHALRCAVQHLKRNGTFVTKVYRSRDSASYQWVCQQLFKDVTTFKPKASRQQSAEIYYVCQGYLAPDKIDPRLLDPKHIFEFVEGDTTQASGGNPLSGAATGATTTKFNVFHKSWDEVNKRQRGGYDTDHLDATMRHVESVVHFVFVRSSHTDAVNCLSTSTGLSFTCNDDETRGDQDDDDDKCNFLLNHPFTTAEIKECVVDLRVLNKGDFKGLMLWRDKMIASWKQHVEHNKDKGSDDDDDEDDDDEDDGSESGPGTGHGEDDDDEDAIQREIQKMRDRKLREKKKTKKKERKVMGKKRRQAALGMDLNAIEVQEHDQFFSLSTLKSVQDLERVAEVNLDQVTEEQAFGAASDDDDDDEGGGTPGKGVPERDEDTGYSYRLDKELDAAYEQYLQTTKNGEAKVGTRAAKRSKKQLREKIAKESHEDQELLLTNRAGLDNDTRAYAKLLQGPRESDDEEDDDDDDAKELGEDDDGFDAEPVTPEEHVANKKQKIAKTTSVPTKHPLIHEFPDEPTPAKTARWFSNPLFAEIGQVVNAATVASSTGRTVANDADQLAAALDDGSDDEHMTGSDSGGEDSEEDHEAIQPMSKRQKTERKSATSKSEGMDADDILAQMPKTDKQKRHEKRVKAKERDERRQARRAKKSGETDGDFDLAPAAVGEVEGDDGDDDDIKDMTGISEERKKKLAEARRLIKAGMGSAATSHLENKQGGNQGRFEVVEQDRPLPIKDNRKYDSDNEEYDSDDYAKMMALGTMMLRQSKAKALVDASYNRFAWNDPDELPEWFVDDENRHYRPQLPIPPALLAKMKEKMEALSTKPIAKVAEARARKNRQAKLKLAAAKKKAQSVANSADMSESMKLKSISKALRSEDSKKGGKTYVVSRKGQGNKGVRGATMVDKRLKSDKRSMERSKRGGKKGSLTGSKKRRHHK